MQYVVVLGAAAVSYIFGAIWYMSLAKPWQKAAGIDVAAMRAADTRGPGPLIFVTAYLCSVVVSGMMRHVLHSADIVTLGGGALAGFGLGLFIATPWIVMNNNFGMKPRALTLIDGTYATVGCTLMGAVLGYFAPVTV